MPCQEKGFPAVDAAGSRNRRCGKERRQLHQNASLLETKPRPRHLKPAGSEESIMERYIHSCREGRPVSARHREAFSMIELIVVILVIAILSSLLLVGVQAAVGRAREAAVGVDIKNLEQGIKEFQSKFSITDPPPSSLILFERADDWDDFSAGMNTQQNAAVIRKLWPNFLKSDGKPSGDVDLNGNGTAGDAGAFHLNGAQCLAFLLGGVMEKDGSQYLPHGFSTNPNNPFYRPSMPTDSWGARIGPFVPLQPSRLIDDVTGVESCFPVYLDAFPGSQRPYQYFSAYGGRGYRPFGLDYV